MFNSLTIDFNRLSKWILHVPEMSLNRLMLDFIVSQDWALPRNYGVLNFRFSAKNLTDSRRTITYDRNQQVDDLKERNFRIGRDYKFTITWTVPMPF